MLRRAVICEIGRARDVDQLQFADAARDQAGVRQRADAQRAIDVLLDQIHRAVGRAEIDFDLRITREEFRQRRRDDQPPDPAGHIDPDLARGPHRILAKQIFDLLDIGDGAQPALVECRTVLGGRHLAGGPMQQADADAVLQRLDRRRNCRAGQIERFGRLGEAAAFDDAGKNAEKVDAIHARPV